MIDEDRTTWTLGQLADEVIEACELPMNCRGTLIAALDDAKKQGLAARDPYAGALVGALTELHAMVWGECPSLLNEDSGGCGRLDVEIRGLLADEMGISGRIDSDASAPNEAGKDASASNRDPYSCWGLEEPK
jgi:hypothetical protein